MRNEVGIVRLTLQRDNATLDDMVRTLYRIGTVVDLALDDAALADDCRTITVHVDTSDPVRDGGYPPGHA